MKDHYAVFREMHVCLQSMSAGLNSVFQGPDGILLDNRLRSLNAHSLAAHSDHLRLGVLMLK